MVVIVRELEHHEQIADRWAVLRQPRPASLVYAIRCSRSGKQFSFNIVHHVVAVIGF
jgi:hypothetical protein